MQWTLLGLSLAGMVIGVSLWTASLWTISYRRFGTPGGGGTEFSITADRGMLWATTSGTFFGPGWRSLRTGPTLENIEWWPQEWWRSGSMGWMVRLPLWPLPLAGTVMSLMLARRLRALRRAREAFACLNCGYSRSGLATQTPCPECGGSTA